MTTTVLQVCTRSLRRLGIIDALASASAEDAAVALTALNEMLTGWASHGCDLLLQAEFALSDTFEFWVPPVALEASTISVLQYVATWNASTNSPTLAEGDSTEGYVYKVSTAGSTELDDVTSWAVNDYAVYDGTTWYKGTNSARLTGAVVAMLAKRLADEFGSPVPATLAVDAIDGWQTIQGYYVKPAVAGFDLAIRSVPSRSWMVSLDGE